MRASLRVALLQMTSTDQVEVNVSTVLLSLQKLKNHPVDIVFLPENSLYFNFNKKLDATHALSDFAELNPLKEWAVKNQTAIHFGGVPVTSDAGGVCNRSFVLTDTGEFKNLYDKIHLFDVDVAGKTVRESDSFIAGSVPAVFEFKGWRLGLSICYDLRFSELFIHYHKQKVDAVLVPSSFLVETGRAHWNVLLRARAIETQAYVLAPAQCGLHRSTKNPDLSPKATWGETLAVGPWGEVLGRLNSYDEPPQEQEWITLELASETLEKVRAQMPTLRHRKLSL